MQRFIVLLWLVLPLLVRAQADWQSVAPGIDYMRACAPQTAPIGDSHFDIVRVDPDCAAIEVLTMSETGRRTTAPGWAEAYDLQVVTNAGMFLADGSTHLGYLRAGQHTNQPRFNADNSLLVVAPTDTSQATLRMVDRGCEADWETTVAAYGTVIQGIRMVDCHRRNKWSVQDKMWSTVAVGTDGQGRMLVLFCRSPYRVHDFIDMALAFPIDLQGLMYLEGGPEASLYVRAGEMEINRFGSYETGFYESDDNDQAWALPNVIGVKVLPRCR